MSLRTDLLDRIDGHRRFVIVTVIEVSGSAPREVGARMVVTESASNGSIGGGNLEFQAIHGARELLARSSGFCRKTEYAGLGITLKQCCGGAVQLMYEVFAEADADQLTQAVAAEPERRPRFLISCISDDRKAAVVSRRNDLDELPDAVWDAARGLLGNGAESSRLVTAESTRWFISHLNERPTRVVLFGAGHVGKALVKLLQDLPFQVDWVDQRSDEFPEELPDNARAHSPDDLFRLIDDQPDGVYFVVMTHDHGLDYELCLHILKRRKFGWLGLIGSEIKRRRFEQRFAKDGIDAFTLQRLICPIGLSGIRGKYPAVIALSTAAQLLEVRGRMMLEDEPDHTLLQSEAQQ